MIHKYVIPNAVRLFGCYEALSRGHARHALVDMTGGVAEPPVVLRQYNMGGTQVDLFRHMEQAHANRSMMIASISVSYKDNNIHQGQIHLFIVWLPTASLDRIASIFYIDILISARG